MTARGPLFILMSYFALCPSTKAHWLFLFSPPPHSFILSSDLSTHSDPHKSSISASHLPAIAVSSHTFLQLTASPTSPASSKGGLSLSSLSFLCQWGLPLALRNNKAFKGWWQHCGYSLRPAHGSRKITCWRPLRGERERGRERAKTAR